MDFSDHRFSLAPGFHIGKEVIWIIFDKDPALITYLRSTTKARWSATQQKWYAPDLRSYRELFGLHVEITGKSVLAKIHLSAFPGSGGSGIIRY